MKVIHLNHSDISGGAARAAYRIHSALNRYGVKSRMRVCIASSGDWTVKGPRNDLDKLATKIRPVFARLVNKSMDTANPIIHSTNIIPSSLAKELNESEVDIIHLHWINGEMLSVADINKIKKPLVWTLHDMWPFCGAEHYTFDTRWRDGYTSDNRPTHEHGFDLNRWTFYRKRKHWRNPIHIVAPSRWLADCAKQSVLMSEWPITVIPNTIDVNKWRPINKLEARAIMGLPPDVPLLLFGAMGGVSDPRKGFDLLKQALDHLSGQVSGLELVIFGQLAPKTAETLRFPVHYMGHLHDDVSLQLLYSAADVLAIPSRQDNLPNTGIEAHACGTAVVAFDTCGLPDIVDHKKTGYLAKAFDAIDFAAGIHWVLNDRTRMETISIATRKRAVELWSNETVTQQYKGTYKTAIENMP